MKKKPFVASVSVSFIISRVLTCTRTTVIKNNIDDQRARVPSIQFLPTNLYLQPGKSRSFVQKLLSQALM